MRLHHLIFLALVGLIVAPAGASAQGGEGVQQAPRGMRVKRDNFREFYRYDAHVTDELRRLTPAAYHGHPEFGVLPWDARARIARS